MRREAEIRTIAIGDFRRTLEALNVDDLTAEGRVADFAAGWDAAETEIAALRAAVKVLREACSREMQFLIRQSCAPHVEGVSLEDLYVDHAGNLQAALASTSKFEEPSG